MKQPTESKQHANIYEGVDSSRQVTIPFHFLSALKSTAPTAPALAGTLTIID